MTGMMRATPISVHFSIAQSMRSNLKMASASVIFGAADLSLRRCFAPSANSMRSYEIVVIVPRRTSSPVAMSNSCPTSARRTRARCAACSPTRAAVFPVTSSAIQRRRVIVQFSVPSSQLSVKTASIEYTNKKFEPSLRTENRELRTFLNKHVLHPSHKRPVLRFVFHRRQFSQFGQQFALAFAQLPRRLYSYLDEKIAFAVSIEYWHSFIPDAKRCSRLRAFGNFQLMFSLQRRNHNLGAQGSLRKRDRNHAVQVVALALKEGVLLDVQDNVQIARRPSEGARFAQAGETNSRAVLHSRGHLGFDHPLAQQAAFAFTFRAGIGDYAARALASWAGSSDAEEALLIPHLTAPIARPAGDRSFAGRRTIPAARVAGLMAAHTHLLIGAENRLLKFEMQIFAKIGSALRAAATTS